MPTFSTVVEIEKYMEKACSVAVENACNRLLGTLQQIIDEEYYDVYEPDIYNRTYAFWHSAMTEMLDYSCGRIFMNPDSMDYKEGWSGEAQIRTAAEGLHGGLDVGTNDHRYWDKFLEYCNENAVDILRQELQKQGIVAK